MYTSWNAPPGYFPWDHSNDPPVVEEEEEQLCIVCEDAPQRAEDHYCGPSCQQRDEEGEA